MIMTGDPISAERALAAGLITRVVPRERLHDEALAVATDLAARPQAALRAAKEAMTRGEGLPLAQALHVEATVAARAARDAAG
jgi:enoyl-CoA hydratase/carnithine racemase